MHIWTAAAKAATVQNPQANLCSWLYKFNNKIFVRSKTRLISFARSRFYIEFEFLFYHPKFLFRQISGK